MKKHPFMYVVIIGIIFIVSALFIRFGMQNQSETKTINASSLLTDTIDLAELSTAEFKYKGIAEIYSDENKTKLNCRACYEAVVKAGIDMKKVQFDVDEENNTVIGILPDIELKVTIVDEQSMALLPSNADVDIASMLKYCREDAENEARQSEELMRTASENIKATIEGILYPVLKAQQYALTWQ